MRLLKKCVVAGLGMVALAALTGCSGINASRSVSPLDFLLPGFGEKKPSKAPSEAVSGSEEDSSPSAPVVASVR
jgi:hypothetical protein